MNVELCFKVNTYMILGSGTKLEGGGGGVGGGGGGGGGRGCVALPKIRIISIGRAIKDFK